MKRTRLPDYIKRMIAAAEHALAFTEGVDVDAFLRDVRTQMATTMALMLLGETASRIFAVYPEFMADHPEVPWTKIRGM